MQAVPSLVGTGAVVAAAASGLVFGQPLESTLPFSPRPSRPSSPFSRKLLSDFNFDSSRATPTPPLLSRPGTSSAIQTSQYADAYPGSSYDHPHPSPLFSHPVSSNRQPPTSGKPAVPPHPPSRRQSYIRPQDVAAANPGEGTPDSAPSHNSWMKRLSLRPSSQQDSPRSSGGPDSFLSASQELSAPGLFPTVSTPTIPPNKLVKRNESIFSRRQSKGQIATLRRPATSHQRSATVQQLPTSPGVNLTANQISLDPSLYRPRASTVGQAQSPLRLQDFATWTSFFHMRRVRTSRRGNVITPTAENSPSDYPLPKMRIRVRRGSLPQPFLIKPQSMAGATFEVATADSEVDQSFSREASVPSESSPRDSAHVPSEQSDDTPTRRARLSLTSQFGPSSGWKAKAGSLRRPKRHSEEFQANRRYASDPTTSGTPNVAQSDESRRCSQDVFTSSKHGSFATHKTDIYRSQEQSRDSPSAGPAVPRFSAFHLDTSRLGPSSPSSAGYQASSPTQLSPVTAPFGAPGTSHSRTVSKEGASTLAGSEMSVPGLASGDEDADYKSETLFDSFRTTDTDRMRMVETPLNEVFDDPLHGPSGNVKTKRLSIQEMLSLGNSWDGNTRILEEEEESVTPIRGLREPRIAQHDDDRATEIAKYQLAIGDRNLRLSLDTTDDDDEWAKDDDDVLSNPLSPPTSSLNSRRGPSPPLRSALSRISGNSASDAYTITPPVERPRSNLFDWSEPPNEKTDDGFCRPKTAHGKQEVDLRGGRPSNRKGVAPAHVRSQSVPVVQLDPLENSKAKFGTWAVGNKNASEDWDDDFDFDEGSNLVPEAIQATQPTVKAHSGQIRELSHLVNNLKRLCRQGRELNLMNGPAASLWQEAEDLIMFASPDEEEAVESDTDRSFSDFDPSTIDERFLDEGFDASTLDRSDGWADNREPGIPKNAVVKERQVARRRSVFSPEDDIFGQNRDLNPSGTRPPTPRTPERVREFHTSEGTVVSSVVTAMDQQQQRSQFNRLPGSSLKPPTAAKSLFDTTNLQNLVKQASTLFHELSDIVRREDKLASPQATPRHDRHARGDSPAFTRVFSDPEEGSPRHLVRSQKSHSPIPRSSLDSNGLSQRMQMMTVS